METALYYTLSTIAQTLAGALAVLVAVVLFRLQGIEDLIGRGQALLQRRPTPYAESWPILLDQGWQALAEFMKSRGDPLQEVELSACKGAHSAWRFRSRAVLVLYLALGFTVVDIALCFTSIPVAPLIASSRCATWGVLLLAVGLGTVCLALYVWLIAVMVGRRTQMRR